MSTANNTTTGTEKITSIMVRMYRGGTGDFFLLKFIAQGIVIFKMMIDCGCIQGSKEIFAPLIQDLAIETAGKIDLLIVTHEHADHINGFKIMAEAFEKITIHKVWFAWTEDDLDIQANTYRKKFTKIKMALAAATNKLNELTATNYYATLYQQELHSISLNAAQKQFVEGINGLNDLNILPVAENGISTMVDLLKEWKIIKENTIIEFLSPGDLIQQIPGLVGIRIFVLGPPKELSYLSLDEKKGETYEKRESKSTLELSFVNVLTASSNETSHQDPFNNEYELVDTSHPIYQRYNAIINSWRTIDHDWLYNAGSLALKLQQSINNTSFALAIQFEDNEHVLLFPGDAEYGCWQSWHDNLTWNIQTNGKSKMVDTTYLLNNTVFYKISHHLSQNGTAKKNGVEMMTHNDLAAMATLDLKKIMSGWRNTMPNDFLSAALISRTNGKIFFTGDYKTILKNIQTDRVNVRKKEVDSLHQYNQLFDGKIYTEYEVK